MAFSKSFLQNPSELTQKFTEMYFMKTNNFERISKPKSLQFAIN